MKKLALFPMTRDQCAIARFSSLLQGYELVSLFIPPFLPFDGRDSNFLDKGQPTGMLLTHYSAEKLNMCDVLYIDYDDKYDLSLHKEVYEFAISQGKEVILTRELTRKLGLDHFTPCSDNTNEKLFDITIPVVTVFSQGKNSDQFATELALRQYFTDKGYRISHIGSNEASKFFNFVHVPKFLFDDSDAYMKIIRFNHYAKALIDQEKPDLLIIGAPDTIMKYNNNVLNGLGVLPFIVSSAVKADVAIATAYYNKYEEQYFNSLSLYCHYRLGCPAQFVNISNTKTIYNHDDPVQKLEYLTIDNTVVLQNIETDLAHKDVNLFSAIDSESAKSVCSMVENVLAGYIQVAQ